MRKLINECDEKLISLYVGGCNEAFDVLIERHKNRVFSYIFHSVKSAELADDIFQETFVKVIMNIRQGKYTENGKFSAWIMRIAHNLIIDHFRQEKSENLQSTDSDEVDILNRKELSESNVEDALVQRQTMADIHRLIAALPMNQREVLIMRYFKNLSFKEIAEITNVSINTALGRMRYAILNMRRMATANNIILTM